MSFGENLRKIRKAQKVTQKELAARTGLSANAIRNYENNGAMPNIVNYGKILQALFISVEDLPLPIKAKLLSHSELTDKDQRKIISIALTPLDIDTTSKLITLNEAGQQKANEYITDLAEQDKYIKKPDFYEHKENLKE